MADPTYDSLDKMFGGGPLALHFQMNQMDQAKQVAAEDLRKKQEDIRYRQGEIKKQDLANMFEEKNMEAKLEEQPIKNRNDTALADINVGNARVAKTTEQYRINDAARAELTKLNDHQLKLVEQEAQKMMMTGTPAQQAQGAQVMQMTKEFAKSKYESDLIAGREATLETGRNSRNAADNASRERIAAQAAAAKAAARTKTVKTLQDRLGGAKNAKEKAEILETAYYTALEAGDNELAAQIQTRALEARARAMEDKPVVKDEVIVPGLAIKEKPGATAPIAGSGKASGPTVEQMRAALRNNLK